MITVKNVKCASRICGDWHSDPHLVQFEAAVIFYYSHKHTPVICSTHTHIAI